MIQEKYLSRKEAAQYLLTTYGYPAAVTATTLAKFAVVGGGPILHFFGRRVGYKVSDLDEWAKSRCSPPAASTSEHKGRAVK